MGVDEGDSTATTEHLEQSVRPALVLTKLHPPPGREQTVARERLVDRLAPRPGVKLTVVAAPAGCGKTTLLGMWRESESSRRPIGWVTLDEGDDDSVVLWSHVLEALRRACPDMGELPSPGVVGAGRIVDVFLPRLVNALIEQGDITLILDDFHRLSSGAARDSVGWLVEHAPSTFQLVLASRREPALALGVLRARGQLVELRADELSFTSAEARELLNGRLELGLRRADVNRLVERTEGWPAGLYLAGLSLGGVHDRHEFVSTFGGTSRHVVDFMVSEVLEAHDPAMQELMLRSSILGRLCGPLCDALLQKEGNAEQLRELARTNLFLIPLDDPGEWYRFHHLFAQLLRVQLEHRDPGLAPSLHRHAFEWHRDRGSVDEAIEHALQAGAFAGAADVVAGAWPEYVSVNRHATVVAWLERLPPEQVRQDSRLLLVAAWVFSLLGEREPAAEAIAAIEQLDELDEGPLPDGFSSVEAGLATLRGCLTWGDVGNGTRNARRAAELEGPGSRWRSAVCFAVGTQAYHAGDLDEADRWLAESAVLARARGHWSTATSALAYGSLVAGERGRVDDQTRLANEAVQLGREHGFDEMEPEVRLASGASLAALGKIEQALTIIEQSLVALRLQRHPLPLMLGLLRYIALLQAAGRDEAAAAAIAEANSVIDSCVDLATLPQRLAALERPARTPPRNGDAALSDRELVILKMLAGSLTKREIGRELYLSHNTVSSHTKSIYRKLGASSRADALAQARRTGIL